MASTLMTFRRVVSSTNSQWTRKGGSSSIRIGRPGVIRPWVYLSNTSNSFYDEYRWMSTSDASNSSSYKNSEEDRSITIGDVCVDAAPRGSGRPDLVPTMPANDSLYIPSCNMSHLRWMLQKDLALQQDFVLLGPPSLARDRRHLLLLYAALVEREVEYVALSRDTSDADLKQRKEVSDHASVYVNQAPVRAALNGRLLILDGLEKAERNVLPTLNNLLENRELSLDDGGLLVSPKVFDEHNDNASLLSIHRVHPDFRVAALASESTLDPPLRSRFQARLANFMDAGEMLHTVSAVPDRTLDTDIIKELVGLAVNMPEGMSLQSVQDAARYLERNPNNLSSKTAMNAYSTSMLGVEDIRGSLTTNLTTTDDKSENATMTKPMSSLFVETKTTKTVQDLVMSAFESGKKAVAIVGPKGSYKSALARQLARRNGSTVELFSLYSDMNLCIFFARGSIL